MNHFWLLIFRLLQNRKTKYSRKFLLLFSYRNKHVYLMSTPQMQKHHDASTLWFNSYKMVLKRRVCFTRYGELRGVPAAFTASNTDLLISITHVAANACRAGGPNGWQSVQLPSSHCTAPPQLLLLEKYTSNFGFVISNWSNPLNGFPGHQSACQKDRGRENVRRNTRKSPSLKIK